jgi:hypothetical protein
MDEKIASIEKNDTWKLVPRPSGKKVNKCQVDLQRKEECQRRGWRGTKRG